MTGRRTRSKVGLTVVVYHYVRDLPRTPFPALKGMLTSAFRAQVDALTARFEPATLESALEFLAGRYRPKRDLCLLTFDDGLKEHYAEVLPILSERGIQGTFFVITSCLDGRVAAVHKNHFLMAGLGFECYQQAFTTYLSEHLPPSEFEVDGVEAQRIYRWDTPEVASFKYFFNFKLDRTLRARALDTLFQTHLGDEGAFAESLYLNWTEAREMQSGGMVIGGHSHLHPALGGLSPKAQQEDLAVCTRHLRRGLFPQSHWPFSYPYGDFNDATVESVQALGYDCSLTLQVGVNTVGQDPFRVRRFDTNDVTTHLAP